VSRLFRGRPAAPPPADPWNDEMLRINDKAVTLREVRHFAEENLREEGGTPWETGMAMTIVALCDEINQLHLSLALTQAQERTE
jgi:hypothetical protein